MIIFYRLLKASLFVYFAQKAILKRQQIFYWLTLADAQIPPQKKPDLLIVFPMPIPTILNQCDTRPYALPQFRSNFEASAETSAENPIIMRFVISNFFKIDPILNFEIYEFFEIHLANDVSAWFKNCEFRNYFA